MKLTLVCRKPNLATPCVAFPSFFGGGNLGVDLPLVWKFSVRDFVSLSFPFESVESVNARRRATTWLDAVKDDGAVPGRLKPNDVASPLEVIDLFLFIELCLWLSSGLWNDYIFQIWAGNFEKHTYEVCQSDSIKCHNISYFNSTIHET